MPYSIETTLVLVVIIAAWSDIRTRQIPNSVTAAGALLGFVLHVWNSGMHGAVTSFEGALLGLGFFIAFYFAGGMGAGDVKLFAAVGALVGPQALVLVFVFTGLVGGVIAAAVVIRHGHWRTTLPYGAVIAGGTLLFLLV